MKVFTLLAVAPLVLGALISLVVSISIFRRHITEDQQRTANSIGSLLSDRWQTTVHNLRASATLLEQTSPDASTAVLAALQQECAACQTIWLVSSSGQVEQQVGTPMPVVPLTLEIQAALVDGTEVIPTSAPVVGVTAGVLLGLPVKRAGEANRMLLVLLDLQQLGNQVFGLVQFESEAYGYISDQHGRLLISPRPALVGPGFDLGNLPLVAAALEGKKWEPPYSTDYVGLLASRVDGVWYRMPELGWYVFVEAPLSISSASNWYFFALQGGLLFLTGVAALVLGRRLATTITRPIEQLHQAITRLHTAQWSQPLRVKRQDEIGQLAIAFNSMAQRLQAERLAVQERSEELVLANRELAQALEGTQKANVLKSQFVATISHELRTPLTAVLGYVELLEMGAYGPMEGEQHQVMGCIHENGQHLLQLINDLLDFSKLEAGKLELNKEDFCLSELIAKVVSIYEPLIRAKALKLYTDVEQTLPCAMYGDVLRLRQILLNLLSNAVKFTEQGTVTLQVRREPFPLVGESGPVHRTALDADGLAELVVIEVADTGIGIAPEDQATIFEDFRQVNAKYTREKGGTGLGLSITKRLVELMQGTLSVESALGIGSRFIIRLPLKMLQKPPIVDTSKLDRYE